MSFTKNFKLLISSLLCVLFSIVSILSFLLFFHDTSSKLSFALDISFNLEVGQTLVIPYDINLPSASVSFIIANTSIAYVDGNVLHAVAEGVTSLRATATIDGQVSYSSSDIIVSKAKETVSSYSFVLDCEQVVERDTIRCDGSVSLSISIFDNNNNLIQNPNLIIYDKTAGICCGKRFLLFIISASSSGYIEFFAPDINFFFKVFVIV